MATSTLRWKRRADLIHSVVVRAARRIEERHHRRNRLLTVLQAAPETCLAIEITYGRLARRIVILHANLVANGVVLDTRIGWQQAV